MLTRKLSVIAVILTAVVALVFSLGMSELQAQKNGAENISAESKGCVSCHGKEGLGIGIVKMWQESKHYPAGVGCYECHQADSKDMDAFEHYGRTIATIVSPADCAQGHEKEGAEFTNSRHSRGAEFIGSLDNVFGDIVEGAAAAISGC